MMSVLFLKYYFRNTLWVSYYPVVFIFLELILPMDLTVLPFLFIQQTFMVSNYFTPLSEKTILVTNFSHLRAVVLDNLIGLITGIIFFCVFGLILWMCKRIFMGVSDHHILYQFWPLLIWGISLGNIHTYLKYRWPSGMLWLFIPYRGLALLLVFCVFLVIYKSDAILFSQVLVSALVGVGLSYYLIS